MSSCRHKTRNRRRHSATVLCRTRHRASRCRGSDLRRRTVKAVHLFERVLNPASKYRDRREPIAALTAALRASMGAAAGRRPGVRLPNAGTVEFLLKRRRRGILPGDEHAALVESVAKPCRRGSHCDPARRGCRRNAAVGTTVAVDPWARHRVPHLPKIGSEFPSTGWTPAALSRQARPGIRGLWRGRAVRSPSTTTRCSQADRVAETRVLVCRGWSRFARIPC